MKPPETASYHVYDRLLYEIKVVEIQPQPANTLERNGLKILRYLRNYSLETSIGRENSIAIFWVFTIHTVAGIGTLHVPPAIAKPPPALHIERID